MTAHTQGWEARTLTASAAPWLNRSARAAQSMRAVCRISDTEERRAALARYREQFPPLIGGRRSSDLHHRARLTRRVSPSRALAALAS